MSNSHSLPGPENITRAVLPNGITVLTRSNFNSPSVSIRGYLQAGSLFDSDEQLGLADFAAAALMRGTEKRNFEEVYDALESVGAGLGFSAGTHTTGFSGHALVEDLPLLLELAADALRRPIFPIDEIERLRAQLLTSLAIRAQDTADMAAMTFDKIIFADHPYSRPDDGYPETIESIRREDLVSFREKIYGPRGMVVAVVGAVEAERAIGEVARVLGDWTNPQQPTTPSLPPIAPLKKRSRKNITLPGKSQSDLVLGVVGPSRQSPDYLPASLGNSVLGQFGMMGRIGDVIREQSGLAYYAYSSLSAGLGPGTWDVAAGVNPSNVEKAIQLAVRELEQFVEKGVSEEELRDSQDNFIGRLPLSLESNSGVANSLLNMERYELGLDYYLRYAGLVRAVTPADVLNTARKYFDLQKLAIATAGPKKAGKSSE